jgi:cysteine desulfurase
VSVIYLDYNATTPIHPEVADEMTPFLRGTFGNPSSDHEFGIQAKIALERSRVQVARAIGADATEIVFTSGGTEANNLALKGAALANRHKGDHIITSSVEHPAVSEVLEWLGREGFRITTLPVDSNGWLDPKDVEKACTRGTILVSVMMANNEIGTIQSIRSIAQIAHACGAVMHTDAAQAVGKVAIDIRDLDVDLLSIAGHKLYAPKGVGALFLKTGTEIKNILHGANHEGGMRPGTENVLLCVGLGKACELSHRDLNRNIEHMTQLRDMLELGLEHGLGSDKVRFNGRKAERLPNTSSTSLLGIDAGMLLAEIGHKVAASAGAACHADSVDVSAVLTAIGLETKWAMGTIRFSVGRETTTADVDESIAIVVDAVTRLHASPHGSGSESIVDDNRDNGPKLTRYTKGMGCACKIRPQLLQEILGSLPTSVDPRVLVDMNTSDDAAVYQLSEDVTVIQTVDFFTPIVDDPYEYGAIAAANSLSDVYAMGGTPTFALNIVAFPTARLPMSVLKDILRGAADKCAEAGISILGGHSIDDPEPKFGLVVTGTVSRDNLWTNAGARPGDVLILTKPIGTGLIATGLKQGAASEEDARVSSRSMATLNAAAARSLSGAPVHACTDVTGFGLLGHVREMLEASNVDAELIASSVPVLPGALELARNDLIPNGTRANLSNLKDKISFDDGVSVAERFVLADAQTSGGLLFALAAADANQAVNLLREAGVPDVSVVATVTGTGSGHVTVKP